MFNQYFHDFEKGMIENGPNRIRFRLIREFDPFKNAFSIDICAF